MPLVVAPIPVRGRHPLVRHTIARLYQQQGVRMHVLCVGDVADRYVCEQAGAEFQVFPNAPLGAKWNHAFAKAREHSPDAILYIGSDDWVSRTWCALMLEQDRPVVGVRGLYCLDLAVETGVLRAYRWPHYPPGSVRHQEAIGGGRVLQAAALEACWWRVFEPSWNHNMDWSMNRCLGPPVPVEHDDLVLASVSTSVWPTKHKFEQEARLRHVQRLSAEQVEQVVTRHFPEVHHIFPERKVEYHGMSPLPHG